MKIAMISPPWIPIPPPKYGGIELVVYNLVEGLKELGQEVILYGHNESKVSCDLRPYLKGNIRFGFDSPDDEKSFVGELSSKYAYARSGYEKVDIIHDHTLFNSPVNIPTVHTVHGAAIEGSVRQCIELSARDKNHFVSISDRQKELYLMLSRDISFAGTVHHAINVKDMEWSAKKEDFSLFVGRASWQKGIDIAVRVARKAKTGLIMAIKVMQEEEKDFFQKEIEPLLINYPKDLMFQLHRELPREVLFSLFRRAKCTLFTSHWEEPFGLVMLESMACGTPVIALRKGAAPELIVHGKTGFLADNEEEMVEAMKKIGELRPDVCRRHVEVNFCREKMAQGYLDIYRQILSGK